MAVIDTPWHVLRSLNSSNLSTSSQLEYLLSNDIVWGFENPPTPPPPTPNQKKNAIGNFLAALLC